jgi:hypothetical protein
MNSSLYNKKVKLPDTLIKHLEDCFNSVSADSNVEGYNRNQEIRSSGLATYQQIKRIKNWFDGFSGKKEDAPFILNGGDRMSNWVNAALQQMRNNVSSGKKIKSDGGMSNQYLDSHEKNNFNLNDKHTTTVDQLKVENEIKRINNLIKIL